MGTKQTIGNEKVLIGLRFQPRSQSSLLPFPTDSRGVGERTWERGCQGSSQVLIPFFIFPFPVLVTSLKIRTLINFFVRKLANGSGQPFLRHSTCFHLFFGSIQLNKIMTTMFLFATLETEPVSRKASWLNGPKGKFLNNNLLNSRAQTSQFCFVK